MSEIKMVDLKRQYQNIKNEIDTAIQEVIDNTAFIKGPIVKEFEDKLAKYTNSKHVVACGNGTDALQIALMALDLQPGDEVITSTFTFIATVEVIALLGLKPVLVDVDPDTFNLDMKLVEKAITKKTKAILPVHLFGQCANMDAIMSLANKHKLKVIEDGAQSIGAKYNFEDGTIRQSATMGDIGTTSFFPSKNLGAYGDGGALFIQDDELAEKVRTIANHGMKQRYYYETVGVNSRLDSMQAAILNVKLNYLDEYIKARQNAAAFYDNALKDNPHVVIPKREANSTHVFHQYTLQIVNSSRDELKAYLQSKGIPSMIYYPVPLHKQSAYKQFSFKNDSFKVSNALCDKVLSLPMHTELLNEELEFITQAINNYFM